VKLIHSVNNDKVVHALTVLNGELYVGGGSYDITVYDTDTCCLRRRLRVTDLGRVVDMTSCKRHQCIYISDEVNCSVHRVDSKAVVMKQWPVDDDPCGLSVNSVCNVLVTCDLVIKEFTTDGKLLREISLESSIVNPCDAVELTNGELVVCHGDEDDDLHRVCIVNSTGRILRSYGGSRGADSGQLNEPMCLAVNGVIFVVDSENRRVLMLSPTLSLIRAVVCDLKGPTCTWFDDETGRLYVGDNEWRCDENNDEEENDDGDGDDDDDDDNDMDNWIRSKIDVYVV